VNINLLREEFVSDWRPLQTTKPRDDKPDYECLVKALNTALAYIDSDLYPRTHKYLSDLVARAETPRPGSHSPQGATSCLIRRSLRA